MYAQSRNMADPTDPLAARAVAVEKFKIFSNIWHKMSKSLYILAYLESVAWQVIALQPTRSHDMPHSANF